MPPRKLIRINAVAVALSLLVSIPGIPAWSAVAGTARPGSIGGAMHGTAGAVRASAHLPSLAPSLLTSMPLSVAPSLSAPSLSPAPSLVAPAVLPAFSAAADAAAVPAGAVAAPVAAAAQIRALDPEAFQVVDEKQSGGQRWAERAVSLFDGMLERPSALPVAGSEGTPAGPELSRPDGRFAGPHLFIALTVADPGTPEALSAIIAKLSKEHGFRLDASAPIVRAPGSVRLRGAIPAEKLAELAKSEGVLDIAPVVARQVAPYQRPATENLFGAFVRRAAEKSPLSGLLAVMPLHAFAVPALIFPVWIGLVLTAPPAAAALKPFLLWGGIAAVGTFSFLAPLLRWIPAPLRAAAAYAAVVAGGSFLILNGSTLLGGWLAVNGILGTLAAGKTFRRLAATQNVHLTDRIVNGAEIALHANLIGFSLLLLPFAGILGMGMTFMVLAVFTALTLSLLSERAVEPATEPSRDPMMMPDPRTTPPSPGPSWRIRQAIAARTGKKPAAREPFVAASRKVAELEKLAKTDPKAALALASDYVLKETDKRNEVRIAALRVLESLPIADVLPVYLAYLEAAAKTGSQLAKQTSYDKWWYYQRDMLRRIAAEAPALTPPSEHLLAALRAGYKDWNASVRLMAGEALRKLGQDPGPEPEHEVAPPEPAAMTPGANPGDVQPGAPHRASPAPQGSNKWKWIMGLGAAALIAFTLLGNPAPQQPGARPAPPQVETTVSAPAAPATVKPAQPAAGAPVVVEEKAAPTTPKSVDELTLEELDRIADAAERSAKAAEEQNRMAAEAAKKSSGSWMFTLLLAFAPILLLVWLFSRMAKKGGMGGGDPMGMAKAKTNVEKPRTRFHDVAGIDESMVEVEEIVDYLRNPYHYARIGARVPKGVLLEGPPGSGKTLLARALAGETDANFISMSGSDFVQMFVGVGAARVRDLFEQAKASRPAIIFIDEIDAVGKARGSGGPMGGNDEREQTINAMLAAMDGFTDSTGIIVVAATNRADTLDPALMRPGRFDRKIHVGAPELLGREAILAIHAAKVRLGPDADIRYVARRTAGMTGAFLANVVFEAAGLAARRGADSVSKVDLDEGVDRATIGAKRSLKLSDELKLRIARHESGHVLANLLNEKPELRQPTNKVTIVPHGTGALGFAEMGSPEGDTYLYTKSQLEARLDHAMGGLVAERMYYGEWSTGPGSDLQYATRIARTMVQQLGMDDGLGFPQTGPDQSDPFGRQPFGEAVGGQVHEATKRIIAESYQRVLKRLTDNKDRLDAMSAALMEKETLIDTDIDQYAFGELPKK